MNDSKRRFKSRYTERSVNKFPFLVLEGMGRMIGCNGIDRAIAESLMYRIDIIRSSQWRIHLVARIECGDKLFGKRKMMRSNIACYLNSPRLRFADNGIR